MAKAKITNSAIYDVIRQPIVTEKTTLQGANGKYTFEVDPATGKEEVKNAVESIFGVNVTKVNVINNKGKTKRFRGRIGTRNNVKKAVVTLKEGEAIDLTGGVK